MLPLSHGLSERLFVHQSAAKGSHALALGSGPGWPNPNSRDTSRHFGTGEGGDGVPVSRSWRPQRFTRSQISGVSAWRRSGMGRAHTGPNYPDMTVFEQFRAARTQRPKAEKTPTEPRFCTVVGL